MKLALLFIKWMFTSFFRKLGELSNSLAEELEYNTREALGVWFILSTLASIVNAFLVGLISVALGVRPSAAVALWLPVALVIHLVYTAFLVMFKCFKQERAELFETIKDGK